LPFCDYRTGAFLITVIAHRRRRVLGTLRAGHVAPTPLGQHTCEAWECVLSHRPRVLVHAFQLMPNHWHAVIALDGSSTTLGSIIGSVKSRATRRARDSSLLDTEQPLWQRGYDARRLADDNAVRRATAYVENNPALASR
jgi:REP element-mobilizing transposase RayT